MNFVRRQTPSAVLLTPLDDDTIGSMPQLMYGDLVNGLTMTVFLPFYLYKAYSQPESTWGPLIVCSSCILLAVGSALSWLRSSTTASWFAFGATTVAMVAINRYHWPHPDKDLAVPHFLWQLLIASTNKPLSLAAKLSMGVLAVITAIVSPNSNLADVLPTILGALVVYCIFHLGISPSMGVTGHVYAITSPYSGPPEMRWRNHGARMAFFGALVAFLSYEAIRIMRQAGYTAEGGSNIVMTILVGFVGLEAAGYSKRQRVAGQAHEHFHLVRQAIQVCNTAMLFTDSQYNIVWFNPAFVTLIGRDAESSETSTDDLYQELANVLELSDDDVCRLKACFDVSIGWIEQEEIRSAGKILRVKIARSSNFDANDMDVEEHAFVVSLQDVTQERTMERFARRVALQRLVSSNRPTARRHSAILLHELCEQERLSRSRQ